MFPDATSLLIFVLLGLGGLALCDGLYSTLISLMDADKFIQLD